MKRPLLCHLKIHRVRRPLLCHPKIHRVRRPLLCYHRKVYRHVRKPLLRHYRQVYCEKAITVSLSICVPVKRPLQCHHRTVYGARRPLQCHHLKVCGTRRPVIGHWPLLSSLPGFKNIFKPDVGMPSITETCAFWCRSFIHSKVVGADHRLLIVIIGVFMSLAKTPGLNANAHSEHCFPAPSSRLCPNW